MTKTLRPLLLALVGATCAATVSAQTLLLEDFGDGGNTTGSVISGTSWVGQLTQNATTLTVGGTALSDSGWGATGLTLGNLSSFAYVALSLQLAPTNAATSIFVTFDDGSSVQTVTFLASSFSTSAFTTVYVPITWTINPATVEGWNIGGGAAPPGTGSPAFRMTFDTLQLSVSGAPIPEPSTYAAIFGALALGFVAYRRRSLRA